MSKIDEAEALFNYATTGDGHRPDLGWMVRTMCKGLVVLCQAIREMQPPAPEPQKPFNLSDALTHASEDIRSLKP